MGLSVDLISQFVKATRDDSTDTRGKEVTVLGTIVEYDGDKYVRLDGSELLTPISSTAKANDGERVTVMIKNHTATVTGNLSSPSARTGDVEDLGDQISEFEVVIANKVSTEQLEAVYATIETLVAEDVKITGRLDAAEAKIGTLEADNVTINEKLTAAEAEIDDLYAKKLDAEVAEITYATIENLEATNADIRNLSADFGNFKDLSTEKFDAIDATIENLEVNTLTVEEADLRYANIDFANITEAAIENFFAKSGMIDDLVISDGIVTGKLVGVTIKGDLIEGGTIVADKLVVKGEDGLYYRLNTDGETVSSEQTEYNSLNGSIITAQSVTAEKIYVDDLSAFNATIGGIKITGSAVYSGAKSSASNTTQGFYMDEDGQLSLGDQTNYLTYTMDEEGNYDLKLSASTIYLSTRGEDVETIINDTATELEESITRQSTSVLETCESIILEAVETCTKTGDFETFKESVEAQLKILADEISFNFTTTTEQVTEVEGDFQSFLTTFTKYIRFSGETAITIGSGDSAVTLEIDNETGLIFKKNGVQFGWWDGVDFHTGNIVVEVNERAQFGNFAWIPRSDGSLMFLKVGG